MSEGEAVRPSEAPHTSWTPDGETAPRVSELAVIDAISGVYDPDTR